MEIKLRALTGRDAMKVVGLVSKLGLTDLIRKYIEGGLNDDPNQELDEFGLGLMTELMNAVIPNLGKFENEVHAFLGDLAGLTEEEVGDLGLVDYIGLYKAFFTHQDFKELLQSLSLSMSE